MTAKTKRTARQRRGRRTAATRFSTGQQPKRRRQIELLAGSIDRDCTLGRARTGVITGEVRVASGVTVKIADGATLLIVNGIVPESSLRRAALIFNPGS